MGVLLALVFAAQVEVFEVVVVEGDPPGPRLRTPAEALRPAPDDIARAFEMTDDPIPVRTGFRQRLIESVTGL